jgi:carboxypeptidase Q
MLPPTESANVIGEIVGREKPQEVVVVGGHLDSWDVGQGAHDDGAGVMAALEALVLMKRLGLRPRRTVRVVLFTNEENGLAGGIGYREWIGDAVKQHVAAIEMDAGSERPTGFGVSGATEARLAQLQEVGRLLEGIGAGQITMGGGGADISPLMRNGVPGLGLRTVGARYFDWHHTHADTLDKVDPTEFKKCTAALAVMAYVLADMEGTLAN